MLGKFFYPVVGVSEERHPVGYGIQTFREKDQVWQIVKIAFNVGTPQSDILGLTDSFRSCLKMV